MESDAGNAFECDKDKKLSIKKERVKDIEGTAKTYSDVSDFNP
jgi:hypothetical protein